jgi:hypothetical protein
VFKVLLAAAAAASIVLAGHLSARADGLDLYAQYEVHVGGRHPGKFASDPNVFIGRTAEGATATDHWHWDWLAEKGIPLPQPGTEIVVSVQRVDDARGTHHFVYDFHYLKPDMAFDVGQNPADPYSCQADDQAVGANRSKDSDKNFGC